jgi:diacylglycerol kinase family enzyme
VLVNPAASRLAAPPRRERLVADLAAAVRARTGSDPEVTVAASLADAKARLELAAVEGRELVVVAGGDGTVREAVHDLAGSDVVLGVVPLGTANLFAAAVGIPLDPSRAVSTITDGPVRSVDLGRARWVHADGGIEDRVFAVACGAGFDARIMKATSSTTKRRLGRYGYFATAVRLIGELHGFDARIEVDGDRYELEAVAVIIANAGELIPGLVRPALPVRVADGLLDVVVIAASGLPGAAVGALEALTRRSLGRSATGRSVRLRGALVRVETNPPQPLEIDGDPVGASWLEARSLPASLRVVVAAARGAVQTDVGRSTM